MIKNQGGFLQMYDLLGSVCHTGDAQGTGRDIRTGLEGRGCTSYGLWSVQRSSAARRNVLVSRCLWKENINRKGDVWKTLKAVTHEGPYYPKLYNRNCETTFLTACQISYPPCLWAAGWMSVVPSFSGLAVCWSSSSWNQGSQEQSSSLPCHSGSAANIPLKCTRKRHAKHDTFFYTRRPIFNSAMNVPAGYKLVYKVLLQTTSHLNHEEQWYCRKWMLQI